MATTQDASSRRRRKRTPKRALAQLTAGNPPLRGVLLRLPLWRGALVLAYHRIFDGRPSQFDPGVLSATSQGLERQLRLLKRHFDVISADDLEGSLASPGRRVVITFDDGYRDNYELAFPALLRHGLKATFFLATGFLDRPRVAWWDEIAWMVSNSRRRSIDGREWFERPLELEGDRRSAIDALNTVYKSLPGERTESFLDFCAEATGSGRCDPGAARNMWMTWEMAAEMRDAGMSIGGHTVDHPVLSRVSAASLETEVSGCRRRLQEELGIPMRLFSYPVGLPAAFDDATRECVKRNDVKLAFSLYGGFARPGALDPHDVPRASVGIGMSRQDFALMLAAPALFARW